MPTNRPPKRLRVVDGATLHLRLPRPLHAKLVTLAARDHRTLNSFVVLALTTLTEKTP